jgi:hypothetical protein
MALISSLALSSSFNRLRQISYTAHGYAPVRKFFFNNTLEIFFNAIHLHRRQKFSVRKVGNTFGLTADANKRFNMIVPTGDVFISYRPIDTMSIDYIRCKIKITQTVRHSRPKH